MNNYQFLLQISQGMELPFLTRVDELKDITGHPFWLGTIHILRQHILGHFLTGINGQFAPVSTPTFG
jgi:hypothetical protein